MITFTIYGRPQPKQRPRVLRSGITYTPKETLNYEEQVKQAAIQSELLPDKPTEEALKIIIWCFFEIPKSWPKKKQEQARRGQIYPTARHNGDIDNLAKIVMDGLNGVAYKDDSQIVQLVINKKYSEEPRVEVLIDRI